MAPKAKGRDPLMVLPLLFIPVLLAQYLFANKKRAAKKESSERSVRTLSKKKFTTTDEENEVGLGWLTAATFCLPTFQRFMECRAALLVGQPSWPLGSKKESLRSLLVVLTMSFGVFPLVDLVAPQDWTNPTKEQIRKHRSDWKFRFPLFAFSVCSIVSTYLNIGIVVGGSRVTAFEKVVTAFLLGLANGAIGITTAHELVHKKTFAERFAGHALLCNCNYLWWASEHTDGHHEKVSTPFDPASSRLGESLYSFLPRTYLGTFWSSWEIEDQRLERLGVDTTGSFLKHLRHHQMWRWLGAPLAWGSFIALRNANGSIKRGLEAIGLFYGQAAVASLFLEIVNYLEHYGLERKRIASKGGEDRYVRSDWEPVDPTHSPVQRHSPMLETP